MRIALLILLFLCPLSAEEKKTICLNMIVKNEAPVITRCLASVKPMIDHWVIVDTGSTDGTQDIIRECMRDVPGELYERPWKNFEHNRNEALELARSTGDYILIMDADDLLEFAPSFSLPPLTSDSYRIWIKCRGVSFQRDHLIATRLPWKWVGVLHEVLICDIPHSCTILEGVTYQDRHEGARSKDSATHKKDAAILEEALKEHPDNSRYMFYLALTYQQMGDHDKAIEWFQKRIDAKGWDEEVFWSMLQLALCQEAIHAPVDTVIHNLLRAYRLRPDRPEPAYYLADIYRQLNWNDLAYAVIRSRGYAPKPPTKDAIFFSDWCEDYGLLYEFALCAFAVKNYKESLDACDRLLATKTLPETIRQKVMACQHDAREKYTPSFIGP
jgi:glycosyltransferase involved in cell wall biosynthesis